MTVALPLHKLTAAYERYGRRLPPLANLALLALIAATLARLADARSADVRRADSRG